jgi:hypothetical protein
MNSCKQREKKSGKLIIRYIFLSSRAITSGKINRSKTKFKLDLYLGMAKQCTKYQMNFCKQREKKSGKLIIRSRGIALPKIGR